MNSRFLELFNNIIKLLLLLLINKIIRITKKLSKFK